MQNLGVDIAGEKGDGTLEAPRRLAAAGDLVLHRQDRAGHGQRVLQATLLLSSPAFAFGVALPTEPEKWLTFAWVFLLG